MCCFVVLQFLLDFLLLHGMQVRKVMNALDNERESRATDMLLNYETIKYFTAENAELSGYDTATRKYQASTLPAVPIA